MPTYQYACTACDHAFDQVQSFSESSLTECPQCGGRVRKVYNAVGVVFKGSGFYRNDSRSTNASDPKAASSSGDAAAKSDSSAGADSGSGSGSTSSGDTGATTKTSSKEASTNATKSSSVSTPA